MPPERNKSRRNQAADLETIGLEMGNKPPQALEVEEAVLGAILVEPSTIDASMDELTPSCFYSPKHRMIFEAISALVNDHDAVDMVTVTAKLREKGQLEEVGGPVAIADLTTRIGAAANIEFYIKVLKQKAIQRDLITASTEILKMSFDDSVRVDDLTDKAQTKIYDAIKSNVKRDVQDIGSIINEAIAEIQSMQGKTGLSGVPSGFPSIDKVTMGWQKSDLIILAARPSVGKTAFSLNLARNAAVEHHRPVAVFSLEMSAIQLVKRLMTSETGLSADKIKGGSALKDYEWVQLEERIKRLSKAPLYIDDTPGIPLMEFRTKAKRLVKQSHVELIIVDYLQLMQGPVELRGMREQEVAAISRTLKATAKELNIPIIALSQLSRQAVQRQGGGGKPVLSDLRESGSIEQDADMVIFIHRPDFLGLSEGPEDKEKTEIIIAKHRNGQVCDVPLLFKADQVKFVEPDQALDVQAGEMRTVASRMNTEPAPPPFADNEFSGNNEF
ncbi:MAG: replicative DNA helicase [Bacteroidales bacterium]|nr:replicative DNA helicase [Bacteroidales bacterium]